MVTWMTRTKFSRVQLGAETLATLAPAASPGIVQQSPRLSRVGAIVSRALAVQRTAGLNRP